MSEAHAEDAEELAKNTDSTAQEPLFEFSFNQAVKLRSETPNVTSNAGFLVLRQADGELGVSDSLAARLIDNRDPEWIRYPLPELIRANLYATALGYSKQDDADFLAHDPA